MSWPRRFCAVPTSSLRQDGPLAPSSKATPEQIRGYVQPVPEVYARLRGGATEADFDAMRQSTDPHERAVGDTYHHLFSSAGYEGRIEADYENGQLVVQRGQHRVEAAREDGVDYLPVHVRAADERTLRSVTDQAERQVEAAHPGTRAVQRDLDAAHRINQPEATRTADRSEVGARTTPTRTARSQERSR
jgi:hypothetical protein